MPRVLILGASGFIGRQCVLRLVERKETVVHAVSRQRPSWAGELKQLVWHEHNLLDLATIQPLVYNVRPDAALHAAWYAGHGKIWNTSENLDWTAVTLALGKALVASGCRRIVMAGSCAEYLGSGTFREDEASGDPLTLYGKAKMAARILVETLCRDEGVSFAWPRLFHMYGPHENASRLIASAINALLDGKPFQCTDGQQLRDFMHVSDVASALIAVLLSDVSGAINVGSGSPISLAELLLEVGKEIGREDLIKLGTRPRAINDPDCLLPVLSRQAIELKWSPSLTAKDGVANTVAWWKSSRRSPSKQLS